jgi:hypothetical protein
MSTHIFTKSTTGLFNSVSFFVFSTTDPKSSILWRDHLDSPFIERSVYIWWIASRSHCTFSFFCRLQQRNIFILYTPLSLNTTFIDSRNVVLNEAKFTLLSKALSLTSYFTHMFPGGQVQNNCSSTFVSFSSVSFYNILRYIPLFTGDGAS